MTPLLTRPHLAAADGLAPSLPSLPMPWFERWTTAKPDMVAVLLPEPLASEVDELLSQDEEIKAIRLVRERTGLGLLPAHNAVKNRRTT